MPKGGTVDGVVGFAKVDETGVCWGVELSGMAEDLGEGEELVGGASAATETSLMLVVSFAPRAGPGRYRPVPPSTKSVRSFCSK